MLSMHPWLKLCSYVSLVYCQPCYPNFADIMTANIGTLGLLAVTYIFFCAVEWWDDVAHVGINALYGHHSAHGVRKCQTPVTAYAIFKCGENARKCFLMY